MQVVPFFNIVDLVALGFILLSMLLGYVRGLSGEIARLVGIVAAFVTAVVTYDPVAAWLTLHSRLEERGARALAFAAIALTAIMVMFVLRFVCRRVMRVVIEESFDKRGGVLAGLLHSSLLVFIVFVAMNMWPNESANRMFGSESAIGRLTLRMMPMLRAQIAEKLEDSGD